MKLDVNITQGKYWGGAQIPYWLYLVFVALPFTGLFGVDHLLLRSPLTAILKFISIIPLFGFWYFYDIAQAFGEKESVKKYGIGVPYYGPVGIGAGIFVDKDVPLSPPDVNRPWKYIAYVLTSVLFIAFPINKLILGDYWGALAQLLMYIPPVTIMAIVWGFWDIYRIFFDARGLFETGASRMFPASWVIAPLFNKSALGPGKPIPIEPTWAGRVINAAAEVPVVGLQATSGIIKASGDLTSGAIKAVDSATVGVLREGGETASDIIKTSGSFATSAIDSTAGIVRESAGALEKTTSLMGKLPQIAEKITTGLSDPKILIEQAKKTSSVAQSGGALLNTLMIANNEPSVSSTVLLFSVVMLAIGGYVMYTLRKTLTKTTENDDSPPEPRAIRSTFKTTG